MGLQIIPKGFHNSLVLPKIVRNADKITGLRSVFKISNGWYSPDKENDTNKIWGVTHYPKDYKRASIRFGWRPISGSPGTLDLVAYMYVAGERSIVSMMSFKSDQAMETVMVFNKNLGEISLYGNQGSNISTVTLIYDVAAFDNSILRTHTPYFGGQAKAPHTICVNVYDFKVYANDGDAG